LFQDLPDTPLPPLALLDEAAPDPELMSPETLEFTSRLIEKKLKDFGVEVKVLAAYPGPVITRYEIEPAVGVKGSQVVNLVKDLARALSVVSIRVVETIPNKSYMGLEIPNPKRQVVRLSEILSSQVYAQRGAPDPGGSEDAGAVLVRGHSPPFGSCGHRHETSGAGAELVRGRD